MWTWLRGKIVAKITALIAVTEGGARPLGVPITRRTLLTNLDAVLC